MKVGINLEEVTQSNFLNKNIQTIILNNPKSFPIVSKNSNF